MALREVCVSALGAVEAVRCVVCSGGGRVGSWVVDFGSSPVLACVDGVDEVHDEGAGCCEDDVAGGC